jgi:transposase
MSMELHQHRKMLAEIKKLAEALHQIASASPCVSHPGTESERACVFCRTLIDVARDALGRERWPAESVRPDLQAGG